MATGKPPRSWSPLRKQGSGRESLACDATPETLRAFLITGTSWACELCCLATSKGVSVWLVAVVVAIVPACSTEGIKKVTVSGTISYKGQPLQSGILKFVGPEGAYSAASIQSDGTYIITDVVPGEVKVGVMGLRKVGIVFRARQTEASPKPAPSPCPRSTASPETSGVKYTITPETKELHIEIE